MQIRSLFLAMITAAVSPAFIASSFAATGERWTLATDDTLLTIGLDGQGQPTIVELKNQVQKSNWVASPNRLPLTDRVEVNGKSVSPNWTFQDAIIDKSQGTRLTLRFRSTTPTLELKSQWWAKPGPGPIHHAMSLANLGGGPIKIFYQPTLAIQCAVPVDQKTSKLWMWYFHCDGAAPDSQGVYREQITDQLNRTVRTQPDGGMVPLVVVDCEGSQGIYAGIEWGFGDIRLTGQPASGKPGASLLAGNALDFQSSVAAGQVLEFPPGFLGAYSGDIDAFGNRLRKYLFRHSMPEILRRDATYPKTQWNAYGATGKKPGYWDCVESKYCPLADDASALGFEEIMIDVAWWQINGVPQFGRSDRPDFDRQDWPSGMKAAAEYAHRHGMRFGLYWTDNEDMTSPAGRNLRTEWVKKLFAEYQADMWRSDAISGPVFKSDYWSVKGFYEVVDKLQREVPHFQWENCSAGGRIKDYGAMKRCVKVFMSDAYSPLDVRRAFHDGSFAFHPIQLEGHLGSISGRYRPQGASGMKYAFRSMSMGAPEWIIDAPNGGNGCAPWTADEKAAVKSAVATYKAKIRPLVRNGNLYHIFPRPDDHVWDGIEYHDPETRKGVVFIFKPDNPQDTQRIRLRGLDSKRTYRLTFEDGSNSQVDKSGAELTSTGINVTLRGKFISELMFFEAIEAQQPTSPPTAEGRETRMQWWRDAKFGLFIHWGPASLSGKEISWSRIGHPHDGIGHESLPPEVYDNLHHQFNPVKFDADRWMRMAKDAGMKYVVFVAKHHDGFSMWPTKLRPAYSIAATPFKRDICKEIADAAHKHGLKLGWYYSTRDWTHPDYLKDGNAKYNDFYHGQIRELLSNYGRVDVLWFDHVAGNWRDYRFQELFDMIHKLQPEIVINNRAGAFFQPTKDGPTSEIAALVRGDFDTPEQQIGKFQTDRAWESCVTLTECADGGGWSYRPDGHTRGFAECVRMLVSCATGDGNLLLNVGPLPSGEIDPRQVEVLKQMGQWLGKYGESIYGTRGGPLRSGAWGGATYRGEKVWLHVFEWNGDTLRVDPFDQAIKSHRVLTGGTARITRSEKGLEITLSRAHQDVVDTIIEITLSSP